MRMLLSALLGLLLTSSALATTGTQKSTLSATAAVANSCLVQSAQAISFGSYNPTSATATIGSGQLSLRCTKGDVVSVVPISGGTTMKGASANLSYSLYTTSGLSSVWGSPTASFSTLNVWGSNTYFANVVSLASDTLANCQALSPNSIVYVHSYEDNKCYYGYQGTGSGTNQIQASGHSALFINGTLQSSTSNGSNQNYYAAPSGSLVSGTTFSIQTGTSGAVSLSATSASVNTPVVLTYYASVPGAQDVPAGAYTDTVIVQVSF
jgi:spore coat protein U-like protein